MMMMILPGSLVIGLYLTLYLLYLLYCTYHIGPVHTYRHPYKTIRQSPLDQIPWYRPVYTGKIESSIAKPGSLVWGSEEILGDTKDK